MILFSDFDNTMSVDHQVSQRSREAIDRWIHAGNELIINTGRSPDTLYQELKRLGLPEFPAICANGAAGVKKGLTQFSHCFSIQEGWELIQSLEPLTECKGIRLCGMNQSLLLNQFPACVESLPAFLKDGFIQVTVVFEDREKALEWAREQAVLYQGKFSVYFNNRAVDFVKAGCSKASGIQEWLNLAGNQEYRVIGDGLNDLSMIQLCHGYCVKNSKKEVLEAASRIFDDLGKCIESLL